jgi:hypothetical protein
MEAVLLYGEDQHIISAESSQQASDRATGQSFANRRATGSGLFQTLASNVVMIATPIVSATVLELAQAVAAAERLERGRWG